MKTMKKKVKKKEQERETEDEEEETKWPKEILLYQTYACACVVVCGECMKMKMKWKKNSLHIFTSYVVNVPQGRFA